MMSEQERGRENREEEAIAGGASLAKADPKGKLFEHVRSSLEENGHKERLRAELKQSLTSCGWREELKEHCKEVMKRRAAKKSTSELNLESLTKEVIVFAQEEVPEHVKADFLAKLREAVLKKD